MDPTSTATEGGQGSAESGSLFEPYLQAVPESWEQPPEGSPREVVQKYLADAERGVNSQLQEAATLRKQFGDYKDINLSGIQPEQLAGVLDFVREVGSSPEAYQEWLRSEAMEAGLIQQQQQEQHDSEDPELEQYIQSRIEAALNPVAQKLSQFEQSSQEQAQAAQTAAIEQQIEKSFKGLETEHQIQLSDEQKEAILALGETVDSDDFVEQGFAKLRALEGGAQAGFVKDKTGQPAQSLPSGGQAAADKPKTFADVRAAALEMIEQAT